MKRKTDQVNEEKNPAGEGAKSPLNAQDRCSVVPTSRSVLEHKLLAALDDSSKVAILATKEDLDLFILALERTHVRGFPLFRERALTFAKDLRQLRAEAFQV